MTSSALLAAAWPWQPTGASPWWDLTLTCIWVCAAAVALWCGPARWRSVVVLVSLVLAQNAWWAFLGLAAVAFTFWPEDRWPDGAALGGLKPWRTEIATPLIAVGLLGLRSPFVFGSSALLAFAAVSPGAVVLWRRFGGLARRWQLALVVTMFGLLALVAGGAVGTWRAALDTRHGVEVAQEAVAAPDTARGSFAEASETFGEAGHGLDRWWVRPAAMIPVLSQHRRAVGVAADAGARLSQSGGSAVEVLDVDALRRSDGTMDVAAIAALAEPVGRLRSELLRVDRNLYSIDRDWLVPPAIDGLRVGVEEVDRRIPQVDLAYDTLRTLPTILGSDNPRRYLILFLTPGEARDLGGITGNVVEITLDDGELAITGQWRDSDLNAAGPGRYDESLVPGRYVGLDPDEFSQNWSSMADFPTVAAAVAQLYPSMGGRPLDGVVTIDPFGLAAIMAITGPVDVPAAGRELNDRNIVDFLLVEQYAAFDKPERIQVLDQVALATFSRLLSVEGERLRPHLGGLRDAIAQDRLRMTTFAAEEIELLERFDLVDPWLAQDSTDVLAVLSHNVGQDKLDTFLRREVTYEVDITPSATTAKVTVILTNTADPAALAPQVLGQAGRELTPGVNRVRLAIQTPHQLIDATVDGEATPASSLPEFGLQRYSVTLDVAPGEERSVVFHLVGLPHDAGRDYSLSMPAQPTVTPDEVTVRLSQENKAVTTTEVVVTEDWLWTTRGFPGQG